ncbi:MAG TPA: RNA polymerase sigma factor region1.1 domain-containing protein, partial [Alphaproteobacteria bacterium]|nr:RNA polymerase sigma factor region1.1 domain-containing protein [Alphaproteobacteria bacterium]
MVAKANEEQDNEMTTDESDDSPMQGGALAKVVKKIIAKGKERGYITYDELNKALPAGEYTSDQIDETMAMLSDIGITLVEDESDVDDETEGKAESDDDSDEEEEKAGNLATTDLGRTDDPVRMYLREMGTVELLSREGEIAIAKRIEAGREMMIGGICESPLTIQAIMQWHKALENGEMLLRDIIDLEATYSDNDGPSDVTDETGADKRTKAIQQAVADKLEKKEKERQKEEEARKKAKAKKGDDLIDDEPDVKTSAGDDDTDDESSLSLAAMEEELKPQIIETFKLITKAHKKLTKVQEERRLALETSKDLPKRLVDNYRKARADLIDLMQSVRLNIYRSEQLIEQLYNMNRKMLGFEGQIMRLAVDCGVSRESFLEQWPGNEVNPRWMGNVTKLPGKGWKK